MKRALKLLASILVTLAFTYWAFRGTDFRQQWLSLKEADYFWLLPYFGMLVVVHLCRTLRWGAWLSGIERVPFKELNEASAIGFMMLIILPFRLGEFARPYLVAGRSGIKKSAAMTSVVLERIVDGIVIAVLLRVLLLFVRNSGPEVAFVRWGANIMFAIFFGGLLFLLFALWQQERAVRLIRATAGRVSPGLAHKVAEVVDNFVGAMRRMPRWPQLLTFFGLTLSYWTANGLGMWILAKGFGLSLTPFQAFVTLSVLVVGIMIPAAPGMMGTFQAATKVGLGLFLPVALVNGKGLAYANVLWLCQTLQQVGFGFLFLSVGSRAGDGGGLSFGAIAKGLAAEPER